MTESDKRIPESTTVDEFIGSVRLSVKHLTVPEHALLCKRRMDAWEVVGIIDVDVS